MNKRVKVLYDLQVCHRDKRVKVCDLQASGNKRVKVVSWSADVKETGGLKCCLIRRCVSGEDGFWQQSALFHHLIQRGLLWVLPPWAPAPGLRTVQGHSPWPSTLHCVLSSAGWPWGEGCALSSAAFAGGVVNVCFATGGIKRSSGMIRIYGNSLWAKEQ